MASCMRACTLQLHFQWKDQELGPELQRFEILDDFHSFFVGELAAYSAPT
jgi:hypothetical protein